MENDTESLIDAGRPYLLTAVPKKHTIETNHGAIVCSRMQVPLFLAYALTVHRGQGQTLDQLICDNSAIFAYGQIYTALSRAREFSMLR